MGIENNSFTFWANMKEAIDVYQDEAFRYKLYDALTELGLYGVWPEEDGSMENQAIISFLQSMFPTLQKSHNFYKNSAELGAVGGRRQKVTDEQLKQAIAEAALCKGGVPTRNDIVAKLEELTGIRIDVKTISRRITDAQKIEIANTALKGGQSCQGPFSF